MSLTKEVVIDKIEVTENGIIQVRQVTRILEDGQQLSASYHRTSLQPGQDLTGQPANVVAICTAAWTPEVILAYQTQVANSLTQGAPNVQST
jgi:hypothetical protein